MDNDSKGCMVDAVTWASLPVLRHVPTSKRLPSFQASGASTHKALFDILTHCSSAPDRSYVSLPQTPTSSSLCSHTYSVCVLQGFLAKPSTAAFLTPTSTPPPHSTTATWPTPRPCPTSTTPTPSRQVLSLSRNRKSRQQHPPPPVLV